MQILILKFDRIVNLKWIACTILPLVFVHTGIY